MKKTRGPDCAAAARDPEDPRLLDLGTQRHADRRADGLQVGRLVAHRAIERQEDGDREAGRLLERRESHHRLGEAAGARVGKVLGREVHDREGDYPVGGSSADDSPRNAGA